MSCCCCMGGGLAGRAGGRGVRTWVPPESDAGLVHGCVCAAQELCAPLFSVARLGGGAPLVAPPRIAHAPL